MTEDTWREVPVVIIGGGLTGLSLAAQLDIDGIPFVLLERAERLGGQIRTLTKDGFTFDVGPNTGSVSTPEVAELFQYAAPDAVLEEADKAAEKRWIWKGDRFHEIPNGVISGLLTPLFSWRDKLGIPFEPFRKKGTDLNETVGALAERRLGKSMVDYAIDPFIGGVYAGDPYNLVTRLALPKLYNLEQTYGSFIGGAMRKAREPKSERDKLATKRVFSAVGGLERLVEALSKRIVRTGEVVLGAEEVQIHPAEDGMWQVTYTASRVGEVRLLARDVVTTVRADLLPALFPDAWHDRLRLISQLPYAPVTEVVVGFNHLPNVDRGAFGGLVPSKERRQILGILFPSSCFRGRVPYEDGALFTIFMGGLRSPEVVQKSPEEQIEIALSELYEMMKIPRSIQPDLVHIAQYAKAIPQYDRGTDERHRMIHQVEQEHSGLHLASGIIGGIGMASRITQGMNLGKAISKHYE